LLAVLQTRTAGLLERDGELSELDRLVEEACAQRGRLVLIEGPPGIGKTRLLESARAKAGARGMAVLAARASELDREFPFGVVRQLYEPLIAAAGDARRERLMAGAAGLAAPLLGDTAAGGAGAGGGTAGGAAAGGALPLFHALYWLTANLAEDGPAALVIDDLHWADSSSLRFLQFLVPRLEELPVLVALATRPGEPGFDRRAIDGIATDPLAVVLRPGPLSGDAVATVVSDELGDSPDDRFSSACREATGGNPFLLRELVRELAADGVAPSAGHETLVRQLAPPGVARAVLLRLARLGLGASALARSVAVLGDGTPRRRAFALADLPEDSGDELAGALADADILSAAPALAFAHPILRAAVYSDMDVAERGRAHRRAAALMADEGAEPDALAVHLLATNPDSDPFVVATLREAAQRARARGAPAAAAACLRRALAEPPMPEERARVTLELASAELHSGEPAAAVGHFEDVAPRSVDPRVRAGCVGDQVLALQAVGRNDDARALVADLVEELADVDRDLALSVEASLIAGAILERSRRAWARERLERHRGRLTGATAGERKLLATIAHTDAFSGDAPAESVANAAERALEGGGLRDEGSGRATPYFSAVTVLVLADRLEPARHALDEAIDDVRRRGSSLWLFAACTGWRAWLNARQGALAEAEADARTCAELSLPQGGFAASPPMLGFVLEVLVQRGELDYAEAMLAGAGMSERPAGHDAGFDAVMHARARLRAARGDLAGAQPDLAGLSRRRARWNTFPALVPPVLVTPALRTGDGERVERMLREARTWGTPRAVGMALHAAALEEQEEQRALDLLAEAASVLEPSPARVEHAHALADLGAALRRSGLRAEAREPLRRALDLADDCGARPLAERARQELRAAGGRPRRPRISGSDALTASEQRVAAMAADGLSNPEIAQALFVTKKTVEAHLGSAYRKLGINSRAQLGAALRG
jgi:DNA-binding NarL/FixJ family response regulator